MPKKETFEDFLKSEFSGSIRVITDNEFSNFGISKGSFVAKAKSLLPDDFDPSKNIDVLPVVFNLAKVNEFNKNGDGISTVDAMSMVKRFANKPINIEHKKAKIVGHIINASFSDKEPDFQENDIESFKNRTDPFFINAAGVIYGHIYPKLSSLISESSDQENEGYQSISTSWELAFREWVVAKGSLRLDECEIISDEEGIKNHKKYIKKFGGKGVDEKGVPVNRLIVGSTIPLGGALTYNPAASVKGVYLLDEELINEEDEDDKDDDKEEDDKEDDEINSSNLKIINEKNSLIGKNIVKIKKFKDILNMNDKQFEQFLQKMEQSIASVTGEESQAKSIGVIFKDALLEQGESWKSQVKAEKEAKEKIKTEMEELKASFEESKKELDAIKAEMETKAAVELFNSRMNFLEDKFEFSDKELEFVTAEVKNLGAEEANFETYKEKVSTLFSHKLKEVIASQKQEVEAKIEEEVAKRLAEKVETSNASVETAETATTEEEKDLETEEAKAAVINNNAQSSTEESLIQKLKQSFSVEVTN
jgi:hypothetical protein